MTEEALDLLFSVVSRILLLDLHVLVSLSTTEDSAPDKDDYVSSDHSNKAGCDADHDANKNRDEYVKNNTLEETGKASMSVVMAKGAEGTRTAMVAVVAMGLLVAREFVW